MANNEYVNRVDYGNDTLIDISDTTAEAGDVIQGQTFYTRSGAPATGTLGDATTSTHGLMSAADKIKLDNLTQVPITYDSSTRTLKFDLTSGSGTQSQVNALANDSVNLKNAIEALLELTNHVAYTDTHGTDYISAVESALYPGLSSISATLTLGNNIIRESNTLNDLKQYLTVTATYSNETTATLNNSDYTLSGTIALASDTYDVSSQTITVSYGGKTTTISVNVYNDMTLDKITLPTGYTQVVMIHQNNNRDGYLDSNVNGFTPARIQYGCQPYDGMTNGSNWHVLSSNSMYYPFFKQGNSGARNIQAAYKNGVTTGLSATWEANTNYEFDVTFPNITINGTIQETVTAGTAAASSANSLYIFARHSSSTVDSFGKIRLYYLKMYNDQNELIHNFIPCTDSSNNVGLYDTIEENFITNTEYPLLAGGAII